MLFSRNLFVTLLAVAAAGVKGQSPHGPQKEILGWAGLCTGYGGEGTCRGFQVEVNNTQCHETQGMLNDTAHSFGSDPWISCVGFDGPGCSSRLENHFVALDYRVGNLANIGLRGNISSISCIQAPLIGKVIACTENRQACRLYRIPAKNSTCHTFKEEDFDAPHIFEPDSADMMCIGFGHPGCDIGPEEQMVFLDRKFQNLTTVGWDISSFNCYKLLSA